MGGILLAPVRDAAEKVADFTYVRLNPAAQQMLALPERPPETLLTLYPNALATGVFAFYREAFESGAARGASSITSTTASTTTFTWPPGAWASSCW